MFVINERCSEREVMAAERYPKDIPMPDQWSATGVIEAPVTTVCDVFLQVRDGPVTPDNAPLLATVPGAGPLLARATLRGGPTKFTLHYGNSPAAGGTVEVDTARRWFAMQGGFKFRAEYEFRDHPSGTLLTYSAFNVAPAAHRDRALVRLQFRLAGKLRIGLRGTLRKIGKRLDCRTHPIG
jgi:hypothetical protein